MKSRVLNRRTFLAECGLLVAGMVMPGMGRAQGVSSTTLTINSAINKAGRQRMLSQRIAKAYCQVGMNVLPKKSQQILTGSVLLFDVQLSELEAFAPTSEIADTYRQLHEAWQRYKSVATEAPAKKGAEKIAVLNEEVLKIAHQGTVQLEQHAATNVGKLVNIAGRQRMLSQRLAKFYMLNAWGIEADGKVKPIDVARADLIKGFADLSAAKETTVPIQRELALAKTQWVFFGNALNQQGSKQFELGLAENVATSSERILEVMDRVTGMYQQL